MEKVASTRGTMEKQQSFRTVTFEKQLSTRGVMEKQQSFRGVSVDKQPSTRGVMEKQKSFRGFLEKQKSFRVVMERQLSFIGGGERKKSKDSPGKRGDLQLHLAGRAGNLNRVKEILQNCDGGDSKELLSKQNLEGRLPFMWLQKMATLWLLERCHLEVLEELVGVFPNLVMTTDSSCTTALHTAAAQGHIDVVNFLLETDSNLAKIARNNGKTVLHSAARMGHLEVVRSLLSKDPSTGFRTDKKGQAAGNTALHIATKKGRTQIARCLLSIEGININALNKAGESPLDIAEKLGNAELVSALKEAGGTHSKDHGKPPTAVKQLKQTVSDIKHDVQSQLQQTRQTGVKVQRIAKKLKKLHISGLNNAINSATVVAVLIATVAFAAIFTVPGHLALFISLAVVVVQTSVVVIEEKAKRQLVFVINKLMWLACLSISVAFISLAYVVVGKHSRMEERKLRNIRRAESRSRSFSMSMHSDPEILNSEYKRMYAL
ncbi:hypothetical protein LWI29_008464 [Acer saccharum]|uniref:PGG domain-containing protein n=1 Tax=Acer saccharum TaxID=4024 RepID=A0AA39TPI4_ACESA|nr:hypothetical protein LWI29_008464 [Acer saccharum]